MSASSPVLELPVGLELEAEGRRWTLPPLSLEAGRSVLFTPVEEVGPWTGPRPLARVLATLEAPARGSVRLLGAEVYRLEYEALQRLRPRLGFVPSDGGLLSNQTVRDNVALPLSVHGGLEPTEERARVAGQLEDFALGPVAALRPHALDGPTRWRACLARALLLEPAWLVLEGLGDWEAERGAGVAWSRLARRLSDGRLSAAVCLPRRHEAFEAWFARGLGAVVHYHRLERATEVRTT